MKAEAEISFAYNVPSITLLRLFLPSLLSKRLNFIQHLACLISLERDAISLKKWTNSKIHLRSELLNGVREKVECERWIL